MWCIVCSFSICNFLMSCWASWYCWVATVRSASSRAFFAERALKASFRSSSASCIFLTFSANDLVNRAREVEESDLLNYLFALSIACSWRDTRWSTVVIWRSLSVWAFCNCRAKTAISCECPKCIWRLSLFLPRACAEVQSCSERRTTRTNGLTNRLQNILRNIVAHQMQLIQGWVRLAGSEQSSTTDHADVIPTKI